MNHRSNCTTRSTAVWIAATPVLVVGILIGVATTAQAGPLLIAGSPGYDPVTSTGYNVGQKMSVSVNNSGTAVGVMRRYVNGTAMNYRAVRWDGSGAAAEMGDLGTTNDGWTSTQVYAINDIGTAVGGAEKFVDGEAFGGRAVRWDASGTTATELATLGTGSGGLGYAEALAVNESGTTVGYSYKYVNRRIRGTRAVRWDASGTAAAELDSLGTNTSGETWSEARGVNDAGVVVGIAKRYVGDLDMGFRPVRWDASGTAATELDNLGTSDGFTNAEVVAINNAGTIVGHLTKYVDGVNKGRRPVRWDVSGTAAAELGVLGESETGVGVGNPSAINDLGTIVGWSIKYVAGKATGRRAVRWDASGTAATELASLSPADHYAYAVNDANTTVGSAGDRAILWLPDASVIDLNALCVVPVPAGGTWILNTAKSLSTDGWVAGEGTFDPDGSGPLLRYERLWVAQVGLGGKWTKLTGGTWGRGPNWSTGTPAMQVGSARFDLDAAYTVALDRDETTKTASFDAGTVSIDFAGHALTTENGLNVAQNATLKGTGTIVGDILNAGTIAPGNSPGTLSIIGDLTSTGTLEFEIASLSLLDQINITGLYSAAGIISVKLMDGYMPALGTVFDLMDFGGLSDCGYVFDFAEAGLPEGLTWDTSAFTATGGIRVVPEPSALLLLAMAGVLGLLVGIRRRKVV